MPTKSKKRRPKKDGHVSYQQVSLAQPNVVLREVDYIVERAARCDPRFVTLGQLLFFSTDTGDAWMLDPEDHLALCLAKAGSRVAVPDRGNSHALRHRVDGLVPIRGRRFCGDG